MSLRRVMKDGQLKGYSVKANRPGVDLSPYGFSKGDVITAIGGTDITRGRPDSKGKVTISSEQSLSKGEVFEVFKDVMRVHGYTLVRTATGEYRVTLIQGAAQDAPFTEGNGFNGRFATTVIKLTTADAAEAARLIKPVMHSQYRCVLRMAIRLLNCSTPFCLPISARDNPFLRSLTSRAVIRSS